MKNILSLFFYPKKFFNSTEGKFLIWKYGWILLVTRWSLTSVEFFFRDYTGNWKPFISPPFGMDAAYYGILQKYLSLPYGLLTSLIGAVIIYCYLNFINKRVELFKIYNISGIIQFIVWVPLQPLDLLTLKTVGWNIYPIATLHCIAAIWGYVTIFALIGCLNGMTRKEKVIGIVLSLTVGIGIHAIFWR